MGQNLFSKERVISNSELLKTVDDDDDEHGVTKKIFIYFVFKEYRPPFNCEVYEFSISILELLDTFNCDGRIARAVTAFLLF